MKQKLQEVGIQVPNFAAVESADDVIKFCEKNGFNVSILRVQSRKGRVEDR
jgi:phosphoribosylaminoimidazole carboxylase (NCAIR synthetase)